MQQLLEIVLHAGNFERIFAPQSVIIVAKIKEYSRLTLAVVNAVKMVVSDLNQRPSGYELCDPCIA